MNLRINSSSSDGLLVPVSDVDNGVKKVKKVKKILLPGTVFAICSWERKIDVIGVKLPLQMNWFQNLGAN